MKKTKAIPANLLKPYLSESEREELRKYQEVALKPHEIERRTSEEELHAQKVKEAEVLAAKRKILDALDEIDKKSIRAIRSGETDRLKSLEDEAATLRKSLK